MAGNRFRARLAFIYREIVINTDGRESPCAAHENLLRAGNELHYLSLSLGIRASLSLFTISVHYLSSLSQFTISLHYLSSLSLFYLSSLSLFTISLHYVSSLCLFTISRYLGAGNKRETPRDIKTCVRHRHRVIVGRKLQPLRPGSSLATAYSLSLLLRLLLLLLPLLLLF